MAADVKPVAASLPERMRTSLLGYWHDAHPWQRFADLVGGTLIAVGLAHLVAWLVVGGAWAGLVSFRKPTTFGISFGLATVTLAWVAGHLRISDRTGWLLLGPLAVADTAEVGRAARQGGARALRRYRRAGQQHRHLPAGAVPGPDRGAPGGGAQLDPAPDLLHLSGRGPGHGRARRWRRDRPRWLDVGHADRRRRARRPQRSAGARRGPGAA